MDAGIQESAGFIRYDAESYIEISVLYISSTIAVHSTYMRRIKLPGVCAHGT
jgi:hypothetical protein